LAAHEPTPHRRVLVVDDNAGWRFVHERLGPTVDLDIDTQTSVTGAYWKFAAAPAEYLAAVVDLDLRATTQLDGIDLALSLVERRKRAKSTTRILCWTSAVNEPRLRSLIDLVGGDGVIGVIDKAPPGEVLRELIADNTGYFREKTLAFERTLRGAGLSGPPRVTWKTGTDFLEAWAQKNSVSTGLVETAVTALCGKALIGHAEVRADVVPPGFSGCLPIRVVAPDRRSSSAKNYLLKLGPPKADGRVRLLDEAKNYDEFAAAIKHAAPLLLGVFEWTASGNGVEARTFSALAYELIGSAEIRTPDFSGHILDSIRNEERRSELWVMTECMDRADSLLKPLGGWYGEPTPVSTDPTSRLIRDLQRHLDEAEAILEKVLPEQFSPGRRATAVMRLPPNDAADQIPNPLAIARHLVSDGWRAAPVTAGTIHGDLNCRNIVRRGLGPREQDLSRWALIDFEDVAPQQHVLIDLATLECDLKFHQRQRFVREGQDLVDPRHLAKLEIDLALANEIFPVKNADLKAMQKLCKGRLPWRYRVLQKQILGLRSAALRAFWMTKNPQALWDEWSVALLCTSLRHITYAGQDEGSLRYAWFAAAVAASNVERALKRG
jgi:hypothetical protein